MCGAGWKPLGGICGQQRSPNPRWTRRLSRSAYFLGAVLFHLLLFVGLATLVIFRPPPATPLSVPTPTPATAAASPSATLKPFTPSFKFTPGEKIKPDMFSVSKIKIGP